MKQNHSWLTAQSLIVILAVYSIAPNAQDLLVESYRDGFGSIAIEADAEYPIAAPEIPLTLSTTDAERSSVQRLVPSPSPLADQLAEKLGITSDQGAAGAGSILRYAKQKLSAEEFQKISNVIPGMDHILTAGPVAKNSSLSAGLLTAETKESGMVTMLLQNDFDRFGLAPDMVGKFLPIIVDYVKSQGGDSTASLLQTALEGI